MTSINRAVANHNTVTYVSTHDRTPLQALRQSLFVNTLPGSNHVVWWASGRFALHEHLRQVTDWMKLSQAVVFICGNVIATIIDFLIWGGGDGRWAARWWLLATHNKIVLLSNNRWQHRQVKLVLWTTSFAKSKYKEAAHPVGGVALSLKMWRGTLFFVLLFGAAGGQTFRGNYDPNGSTDKSRCPNDFK